jgi:hypothetical protein
LTALGILHMAAFVTLCEAFIGIEHHLNLWSYFIRALLRQGSDAGAAVLVARPKIVPYFSILLVNPLVGWRKA